MPKPSTFSIVACDLDEPAWGVAVASKFPAAGAVVPWAQAGAGAVATQSYANTSFGPHGLALMAEGVSAEETLAKLKANIDTMKNISKEMIWTQLEINLLRLESKLALLEYREEKAKELLQEAIAQAEQHNLPKFIAEIKTEQETLKEQKALWQASKKKEEPLKERLEHVAITKSMKEMKDKIVLEERDKETGQYVGQQKLFAIKF